MNKWAIENLPKSRLKHSLTEKRYSSSKPIGDGNEGKGEQPVVNIVTVKKQHRQENTKRGKPENEPNGWNLAIYREQKPRQPKRHVV